MAYIIEREESVGGAVCRIMDDQIVLARAQLTDEKAPIEERVHDARKRFKETRALLRLIREPLGPQYGIENAWFRDAGRDLAAARDAAAVPAALDSLQLPRSVTRNVRRHLANRHSHAPLEGVIANAVDQLVVAQARVALWPPIESSFDALAAGLRDNYRKGRRAMAMADSPQTLHEWRKAAKTHWYHVQLLRNVWPEMMEASAAVLRSLSRALGDHHDLAVLRESIEAPSPRIVEAIDVRQRELERTAFDIGKRVYAERPDAWLARMRKYWEAWR